MRAKALSDLRCAQMVCIQFDSEVPLVGEWFESTST